MDLSQLEVFLTVARERRFSRAAEKLFRTQSAVSQTIRKLELEIGEPLFDRSSRDGVLTDAGRVLQEYAEKLLNLRQDAQTALVEMRELQKGKLAIAARLQSSGFAGYDETQCNRVRSRQPALRRIEHAWFTSGKVAMPVESTIGFPVRAHACRRSSHISSYEATL